MSGVKLVSWSDKKIEEARQDVLRRANTAVDLARVRMDAELRQNIEALFKKAVDNYYGDYQPLFYSRRHSMYHALLIEEGAKPNEQMMIGYDPEAMPFRDGGIGLIGQAFMEGWHGGAGSGKGHPNPGVPYWREPLDVWTMWGHRAEVADTPPQDEFEESAHIYDTTEGPARWREIVSEELAKQGLVATVR